MALETTICVYDFDADEVRPIHRSRTHYEAPNWSPDGETLVFNADGRLYRMPVDPDSDVEPRLIDTGDATDIINDHGISPDGETLAFTNNGGIWTAPIEGGEPTRVTEHAPSYWHGWSPDGETLAYCGKRDGDYNLYTIPVGGGPERKLTDGSSYDDGPDYTPDGKWIYYRSDQAGTWEIWRVRADGGTPERVTTAETENWFPHPDPTGERAVYLAYPPGTEGHPPEKQVELRLLDLDTHKTSGLYELFGGQGTVNVPSWRPDGNAFAFVSYRRVK